MKSDSRPDCDDNYKQDDLCPLRTDIVELFTPYEEKVWDIHGGIYGIPDESEVDVATPPANSDVNRKVRRYTN